MDRKVIARSGSRETDVQSCRPGRPKVHQPDPTKTPVLDEHSPVASPWTYNAQAMVHLRQGLTPARRPAC